MKLLVRARRTVAGTVLVLCAACTGTSNASFAGIVSEPSPDVSAVSLPEASAAGAPLTFRAAPNGLLIAYFGYTSCPDVCPTTMADLRTALGSLSAGDRARVTMVMTTIDPGRDTADRLTAYVRSFFAKGRAARSDDPAQLRAAADAFGADYLVTTTASGSIEVSHTAFVYLIDDTGHVRLTWPHGLKAPDMAHDLAKLLRLLDHPR